VDDGDDLMMITNMGTIIRTPVRDINTYSRAASGVIVMRLADGQSIVNFSKVAHEEITEEENSAEATENAEAPVIADIEVSATKETTPEN